MDNVKDDAYYTKRILKNIEVLTRYLAGKSQDDLLNDGYLCDAIENRFTKLSEDASKLSKDFKDSLSTIPWNAIYSIRNRICHDYDVVDAPTLYKTVKVNFPVFRRAMLDALPHHEMYLFHEPFLAISEGRKNIEMRLNDEKHRLLKLGDLIIFKDKETETEILAEVEELSAYKDFHEVYLNYSKTSIGYRPDETANPDDMLLYYSKDDIGKWGVLAIGIKIY